AHGPTALPPGISPRSLGTKNGSMTTSRILESARYGRSREFGRRAHPAHDVGRHVERRDRCEGSGVVADCPWGGLLAGLDRGGRHLPGHVHGLRGGLQLRRLLLV